MLTQSQIAAEIETLDGGNDQFQLPDGTLVGTGNLRSPSGPMNVFGEYPESLLLEDSEIKRLLDERSIEASRTVRKSRMQNQGQVGSCNAYMAIGMHYQCQEVAGRKHTVLAPEHLYMSINGGRDVGSMLDRGMQHLVNAGCAPVGMVPYQSFQRNRVPNISAADAEGQRFKIHEPYAMPSDYDTYVRAVASALARRYPVGIAWHVTSGSMRLRNGFCVVGGGPGNHASFLHDAEWIGGRDLIHADLFNSWGPTLDAAYGKRGSGWGDGGFGKIKMQDLFATRRYHQHYAMTSVIDDPKGNNPL